MATTTIASFSADTGTLATITAANTANAVLTRDAAGQVAATTFTGALAGNATTATTAGSATSFTGSLLGDVTGTQSATVVSLVGGQTAANVASATSRVNAASTAGYVFTANGTAGGGSFQPASGGGVTGSGTANQVAVWNGSTSLTGNNNYQWDGTQLTLTSAAPSQTDVQPNFKQSLGNTAANANTFYPSQVSWVYPATVGTTNTDGLRTYVTQSAVGGAHRYDNANIFMQRGFPGTAGAQAVGGYIGWLQSGSATTRGNKIGLALGYSTTELTSATFTPALFIDTGNNVTAGGVINAPLGVNAVGSYVHTTELQSAGSLAVGTYDMPGSYVVDASQPDTNLAADTAAVGSITVDLPDMTATLAGRVLMVSNVASTGTNTITVNAFSGQFIGVGTAASVVLNPGQSVTLTAGQAQTNWAITGAYGLGSGPSGPSAPVINPWSPGPAYTVTEAQTGQFFQSTNIGTSVYDLPVLASGNVIYDFLNGDSTSTTQISIPSGFSLQVPGSAAIAGPTTYSTSNAFAAVRVIGNISLNTYTVLEQTAAWTNP